MRSTIGSVALSPDRLAEIADRFLSSLNARDFTTAAALYADGATYESAALVAEDNSEGRITGRGQIMDFFASALDGDDDFQLTALEIFTGLNMAVILSSFEGRTYIDVLRIGEDGLIVEHAEVVPKASPLNFLTAGTDS